VLFVRFEAIYLIEQIAARNAMEHPISGEMA
jgi:hypothetical protein